MYVVTNKKIRSMQFWKSFLKLGGLFGKECVVLIENKWK